MVDYMFSVVPGSSFVHFLEAVSCVVYAPSCWRLNQRVVYIVHCVSLLALAGLVCPSSPDMTYLGELWKELFSVFSLYPHWGKREARDGRGERNI